MDHRIVFMGTPPFAVASLDALVKAGFDVAAVVTAPDKPAGRGQQMRVSAVKEYAMAHPTLQQRILQPGKLRDPAFHAQLDAAAASLYVVVAFRMLPEAVWNRPPLGTINLHASLLPDYRGAAPINWAIINGETRTGVTTFFIRQEIDTGDIIHRDETGIGPDETAGELHDRLMLLGAALVVRSVSDILAGQVKAIPQLPGGSGVHAAPKLSPENCRITWNDSAERVHNLIRGLGPHPGAWTRMVQEAGTSQHFKILRATSTDRVTDGPPGSARVSEQRLFVNCANGQVEALEVQPEGKRRMDSASFLHGLRGATELHFT